MHAHRPPDADALPLPLPSEPALASMSIRFTTLLCLLFFSSLVPNGIPGIAMLLVATARMTLSAASEARVHADPSSSSAGNNVPLAPSSTLALFHLARQDDVSVANLIFFIRKAILRDEILERLNHDGQQQCCDFVILLQRGNTLQVQNSKKWVLSLKPPSHLPLDSCRSFLPTRDTSR